MRKFGQVVTVLLALTVIGASFFLPRVGAAISDRRYAGQTLYFDTEEVELHRDRADLMQKLADTSQMTSFVELSEGGERSGEEVFLTSLDFAQLLVEDTALEGSFTEIVDHSEGVGIAGFGDFDAYRVIWEGAMIDAENNWCNYAVDDSSGKVLYIALFLEDGSGETFVQEQDKTAILIGEKLAAYYGVNFMDFGLDEVDDYTLNGNLIFEDRNETMEIDLPITITTDLLAFNEPTLLRYYDVQESFWSEDAEEIMDAEETMIEWTDVVEIGTENDEVG